jgi:hypothetical protein
MKIIDQSHPFYKPLWRRIAIVAVVAVWAAFEAFYTRDPFWMTIAGGVLVICLWTFLLAWPKGSSS